MSRSLRTGIQPNRKETVQSKAGKLTALWNVANRI